MCFILLICIGRTARPSQSFDITGVAVGVRHSTRELELKDGQLLKFDVSTNFRQFAVVSGGWVGKQETDRSVLGFAILHFSFSDVVAEKQQKFDRSVEWQFLAGSMTTHL